MASDFKRLIANCRAYNGPDSGTYLKSKPRFVFFITRYELVVINLPFLNAYYTGIHNQNYDNNKTFLFT